LDNCSSFIGSLVTWTRNFIHDGRICSSTNHTGRHRGGDPTYPGAKGGLDNRAARANRGPSYRNDFVNRRKSHE
jgi:hypothetical protein